jgi:hypothetical protein
MECPSTRQQADTRVHRLADWPVLLDQRLHDVVDGFLEGYCPPYYPSMDAAVDAVVARMSRTPSGSSSPNRPGAHMMPDAVYRGSMVEVSDAGIACAKAVCNYIYETYGRFPGGVDTMHLMWFMQAHHLDLDYYDKFFHPSACGQTHTAHMATWHPQEQPR